ncbi:MAG: lysophospholipid acyltransferase family protein [Acidimicrobiia bacterium]
MRRLLSPLRTILVVVTGVTATLLAAPIAIVVGRLRPTSPFIDQLARIWSRVWLLASGTSLVVEGREHVDRTRSHVVIANHLSVLDIMVCFLAVPLPIRFLAKKELFSVPVLAPAMRAIGIVEVDREARSAIHEKVNRQAQELVASGRSLIIYPEGTRSRDGSLRPFKKGAFTMAVAGSIPLLPVTIVGTYEAWPAGKPWVFGGDVKAVIHPPIETAGLEKAQTTRLASEARDIIASAL